jgi:uncharacterized membrane protein
MCGFFLLKPMRDWYLFLFPLSNTEVIDGAFTALTRLFEWFVDIAEILLMLAGSLQGYDIRREAVEITEAHCKAMTFVVKQ